MIDTIYIPTFRRPNNQKCFDNLPDKYKKKVIMVVQEQEKDEYDYDVEYLIVGNDIGIAATREQIYNHASKKRYLMVDDDITFYRRNRKYMKVESNMERSKRPLSSSDWDDMFELFNGWMDEGLMHVGCRDSNLIPSEKFYHEFQYVSGAHFINNLECLLRGFKNRISDEFVCDIFGQMWTNEGGLENIRNPQVHYEENIKLMNNPRYKPYIYIKNKIEVKDYGVIDVFKLRFKEAYNSSKYINKLEEFK